MAANDLAMTASTTPTIPVAATSPVSNAVDKTTSKNEASHGATTVEKFDAVLTQVLGTANAQLAMSSASAAGIERTIANDEVALDSESVAALSSADAPWELLLANVALADTPVGTAVVPARYDTGVEVAQPVDASRTSALPTRITFYDQTALHNSLGTQVRSIPGARDAQMLLGQVAATTTHVEPPQLGEGNVNTSAENGFAAAVATSATTAAQTDLAETSRVRAHVGAAAWADELGAKLTWLTERGIQTASLRMSPEHLGPLEVRITVNSDQASVWFGATHADTRIALEQALPRLRELFASQGLNLADAGVFREPPREQAKPYQASSDPARRSNTQEVRVATVRVRGIVDAYV